MQTNPCVVAIPARDEAERIEDCLAALTNQEGARLTDIVLLVNNSSDDTAALARATRLQSTTTLHVIERTFPSACANAGFARQTAMRMAASLAGPRGILMTTDADALVDPDWLAANLCALDAGADAVAGWVEVHPWEHASIPQALHDDDARECAYDALCDEIEALLDPDPADPMPRHTQNSGASLAVTAAAFAACGGIPSVASGEDRALVAALRRFDLRIRHAPEVHATVSGRIFGRAAGGMADTIRRRMRERDVLIDDRLEPAADCARRARLRASLRYAFLFPASGKTDLAASLGLSEAHLSSLLDVPYFGLAWEAVAAAATPLHKKPVLVADLAQETAAARSILKTLRSADHPENQPIDLVAAQA